MKWVSYKFSMKRFLRPCLKSDPWTAFRCFGCVDPEWQKRVVEIVYKARQVTRAAECAVLGQQIAASSNRVTQRPT